MKINNIGYLLKEGIRGIFLHGFMSFAAICVTVACLMIVGTFSSLMYNVNVFVEQLNKTNEIRVFIDETYSDAEAKSVGSKLNQIENIYRAEFVSREQALEDFRKSHNNDDAFAGVDADYLRHRYVVTLEDNAQMDATLKAVQAIPGVAGYRAEQELARGFSAMQRVIQLVSVVLIVVLLFVSLLIISNTVKLAMYDRRDEIAIMKMVGATNGFIRLPFVVEGFTLGMIGAALAFALLWVVYDTFVMRFEQIQALQMFKFVAFDQLLVPMVIVFAGAGLFVGVVGSWTSIRKFMDV